MIPSNIKYLKTRAITDPGKRGRRNEDAYRLETYEISEQDPTPVMLAVVADGVGGHQAGEIASALAIESVFSAFLDNDLSDPIWALKSALLEANHSITTQADSDDKQQGMGSTIVVALIIDYSLYVATLGDSRIYLIRDRAIQQLNIDHTWVQEAIENGVITPDEARSHPRRHLIRSYLGSSDPIQPDLRLYLDSQETVEQAKANQGLPLIPQDKLLLCSDGLSDLVTDDEILNAVESMPDTQSMLQSLVDLANERGGHDNITIILLTVPGEALFSSDLEEE